MIDVTHIPGDVPEYNLEALLELSDYVSLALLRNRGTTAVRLEWEASLERVPQAKALPDPVLSYSYFLSPVEPACFPETMRLAAPTSSGLMAS